MDKVIVKHNDAMNSGRTFYVTFEVLRTINTHITECAYQMS